MVMQGFMEELDLKGHLEFLVHLVLEEILGQLDQLGRLEVTMMEGIPFLEVL